MTYDKMTGVAVFITPGVEFIISDTKEMFIQRHEGGKITQRIPLGSATESRLNVILLHMGSMRIFTQRD